MSDPKHDDQGPLRPQVIDLEAEEIRTEPDTPKDDAPRADGPRAADDMTEPSNAPYVARDPARRRGGSAAWIVAALILGALGGGFLYRGVLASYFPSNQMVALQDRIGAMEVNGDALAQEIAALKQAAGAAADAAAAAQQGAGAASTKAREASAAIAGLDQRMATVDERLAAAEAQVKSAAEDLGAFRASLSSGGSSTNSAQGAGVDGAALAALSQRIDALEKDVASLKSAASAPAGTAGAATVTSALSQALSDIKAKIAAGAPYPDEYERIARMVPAAAGLETVGAHAAEGLPNAQGLTEELRALTPTLPQPAAPAAEDNSYFGTLMKSLSGVITIRQIGETDWPGVAEKAAAFAEAGDLTQAIAVIDAAEGEKPVALTQWRGRAAARLQLDEALAQISAAVLRQISAMGGTAQ